jgi:metallo-beta-lactamase class B
MTYLKKQRRTRLPATLGLALSSMLIGLSALSDRVQANTPANQETPVTFTPLTQGVWMHTSMKQMEKWGAVPSNGLIVEKGDFSILVDTAWNDAQTAEIVAWAKTSLNKPIRWAVFTHAHDDKMGGVAALRSQGIVTYAAADSNQIAPSHGLQAAAYDLVFDTEQSNTLLKPLVIFDPGPGHTVDNIVVGLPDHGIIFGGCLIRPPGATHLGNTADADLTHWKTAALAVANRFPRALKVVPSHGPPGDRTLLTLTAHLAEEALKSQASKP